jgi:ribosome-associated protein
MPEGRKKTARAAPKKSAGVKPRATGSRAAAGTKKKTSVKKAAASGAASASVEKKPRAKKAGAASPPAPPPPTDLAREFAIDVARLLHDDKCTEIVLLDVRGTSQVSDYIVIGTGTSDRQMRSVLSHAEQLGSSRGFPAWRVETDPGGRWLLMDSVDVVVHLFEPNTRAHYDLEMMWGDAPRVAWERPDQMPRDRAGLHASGTRS